MGEQVGNKISRISRSGFNDLRKTVNLTVLNSRVFLRVCRQIPLARPLTAAGLVGFGWSGHAVEWASSMVPVEILIFDREAKTVLGWKQSDG
jgi:hypothetical protein